MDAAISSYTNTPIMLAEPHKSVAKRVSDALGQLTEQGWHFDLKWDGVRCLALVNPPRSRALGPDVETLDGVALVNRNGVDITYRYPDVCAALASEFDGQSIVLDGEVVAFDSAGKPDFDMLSRRDRVGSPERALEAAKSVRCTYVAFDLLAWDGVDYIDHAYIARRAMLEVAVERCFDVVLSPASEDGETMWKFVTDQSLEGLIAKRPTSRYMAGRSSSWVKLKPTSTVSCLVTGWETGTGRIEGKMGALHLGVIAPEGIREIGKVGTGFTDEQRGLWAEALTEDEDMGRVADGYYARYVVEVEYQNLTKDGRLRFPSYKGVRNDLSPAACGLAQVEA